VLKLRERAPKSASSEAFVVIASGGASIDVTAKAKGTSVRPGSRSGAKATGWITWRPERIPLAST